MRYLPIIILFLFPNLTFSQAYRSEIISYVSRNSISGDKLIVDDTVVLQINERMGDYDAKIAIDYSREDKLSIGDAWIEDMSGNIIRKLKNKEIETQSYISSISLYEDDFIKFFELKHNVYPYRIKYSYKKVFSKFLNVVNLNYLGGRTPIGNATVIVETTKDNPIRYKQENIDKFEVKEAEKSVKYIWQYSYTPPKNRERKSSFNSSKAPMLQVVPINFKYGERGSYDSWETFGNWISQLNRERDKLPLSEKRKIDAMLKDVSDDKDKAKILYKYMQDYTRYILVNINVGGFQTYPASYVCENKYGDCKALTNYMQAMLKHIGIKSYYTLIYGDDVVRNVDTNFPIQSFNHVILTIPFEKDTVYLECTAKNTPFGYISTFIQGRKALLVDEMNSRFIDIPSMTSKDVLCSRELSVDLQTSEVNLSAIEKGSDYELSLYLLSETNKSETESYIQKSILSGSYDLLDYKISRKDRDSDEIAMTVKCKVHNLSKTIGNNLVLTPFPLYTYILESPDKRETDIQLDYPEYYKDIIVYDTSGKNISKIPDDIELKTEFGEYSLKFKKTDTKFIVEKSLLIFSGLYSLDKYKGFYQYIEAVKNNENKNYYLETL